MHAKLVRTFAVECGLWWNKPNACVRVFCSGMASHGRVSGQNVPSPPSLVAGDREDRNFGWHIVSLPKHPWTSVDPFAAGRSARYAIRRNKSGPRGVHYSAHASAPRPRRVRNATDPAFAGFFMARVNRMFVNNTLPPPTITTTNHFFSRSHDCAQKHVCLCWKISAHDLRVFLFLLKRIVENDMVGHRHAWKGSGFGAKSRSIRFVNFCYSIFVL